MKTATNTTPSSNGNGATAVATQSEKPKTLVEISENYSEFFDLLDQIDLAEVSPEQQEQLNAFLADLDEERNKKLDNIGAYYKNVLARGKYREQLAKDARALAQTDLNKAEYLKNHLLRFFQFQKISKSIDTLRCKIWKQRNGQGSMILPEGLEDSQARIVAEIPEEYREQVWVINTAAIREQLEANAKANAPLQTQIDELKGEREAFAEDAPEYAALTEQITEAEKGLLTLPFARLEYGEHVRIK